MAFKIVNVSEAKDSAPEFGLSEIGEARFLNQPLETERTGLSHYRMAPGARHPFGHRHEKAEEVYLVLSGSGRVKLDDEIAEIGKLDAIRVDPEVMRSFEAGPEGLELIALGQRHDGDGELVQGWWSD